LIHASSPWDAIAQLTIENEWHQRPRPHAADRPDAELGIGRAHRRQQEERARDQQAPLATESFAHPTGDHRTDDAAEQRARDRPPRQAAAGGFGQIQWLDEIHVNGTDGA